MYPPAFSYRRAASLDEALAWLAEDPQGSKVLAGGHSLLPLLKLRLAAPGRLIDIGRLDELKGVRREGDALLIGAATTYRHLAADPLVTAELPALAEAAARVGDLQVRNWGTVGGSLAHADPAADVPAALLALGAELEIRGPEGARRQALDGFWLAPLVSGLGPAEILTGVRVPLPAGRSTYLKRPHPASGYAMPGVAVVLKTAPDGTVTEAAIAVTGAAELPYRARAAEAALTGRLPDAAAIGEAARAAGADGRFSDDAFSSAAYRRQLVTVYVGRALERLAAG